MLNILIPAAGSGIRFQRSGYIDPKPMIDVCGKPMLQRVMDNLHTDCRSAFIIITKQDIYIPVEWFDPEKSYSVIKTTRDTDGAASTCLLAKYMIDNDNPLLIANCDQLIDGGIEPILQTRGDAAVLTTKGDGSTKWSYAKVERHTDRIEFIKEKEVVSDRQCVGVFWWRRGRDFIESATRMMMREDKVNGEYYVAPTFNYFPGYIQEVKVESYKGKFNSLGTPADLEDYIALQKSKEKVPV